MYRSLMLTIVLINNIFHQDRFSFQTEKIKLTDFDSIALCILELNSSLYNLVGSIEL